MTAVPVEILDFSNLQKKKKTMKWSSGRAKINGRNPPLAPMGRVVKRETTNRDTQAVGHYSDQPPFLSTAAITMLYRTLLTYNVVIWPDH